MPREIMTEEPSLCHMIGHAMERGEARAAQAAGWIGFNEGRSLFGAVAEPTTAVDLQDGVMGSSHHQRCDDCDAALRPETSDGGVDYVYRPSV